MHPLFADAFSYLSRNIHLFPSWEDGVYTVVEDPGSAQPLCYMTLASSLLRDPHNLAVKYEAHDRYIDIQVPLTVDENSLSLTSSSSFPASSISPIFSISSEYYGVVPRGSLLTPSSDASITLAQSDILFFEDPILSTGQIITLKPSEFIVFFPWDAHAPLLLPPPLSTHTASVRKAIFKVLF